MKGFPYRQGRFPTFLSGERMGGLWTYALNMSAKSESRFHVYVLSQCLYFVPRKWMHLGIACTHFQRLTSSHTSGCISTAVHTYQKRIYSPSWLVQYFWGLCTTDRRSEDPRTCETAPGWSPRQVKSREWAVLSLVRVMSRGDIDLLYQASYHAFKWRLPIL